MKNIQLYDMACNVMQFSEEQLKEILGSLCLIFSSYYKYSFTFKASTMKYFDTTEEEFKKWGTRSKSLYFRATTYCGGASDDIYRYKVSMDDAKPLFPLEEWSYVLVEANGKETNDEWVKVFAKDYSY